MTVRNLLVLLSTTLQFCIKFNTLWTKVTKNTVFCIWSWLDQCIILYDSTKFCITVFLIKIESSIYIMVYNMRHKSVKSGMQLRKIWSPTNPCHGSTEKTHSKRPRGHQSWRKYCRVMSPRGLNQNGTEIAYWRVPRKFGVGRYFSVSYLTYVSATWHIAILV